MTAHETCEAPDRRDVLLGSAGLLICGGAAASLWPLIDQMNPNAATPAPSVTEVDLQAVAPGQEITVPVSSLRDPLARNAGLPERTPADDINRALPGQERWLVAVGLCTHLGCRLIRNPDPAGVAGGEAWFCPCHASRFDAAGRVRSGPALTNLPVPPVTWLGPTRIRIG